MGRWSLFSQSVLTVVPAGVIIMLAVWMAAGSVVQNRLQTEQIRYAYDTGRREASRVEGRLDAVHSFLVSLAHNDLIVNGLIDAEGRSRYLPALFRSLEIPGFGAARLRLRDSRGQVVIENKESAEGVDDVTRPDRNAGVTASDKQLVFRQPVLHLGSQEGSIEVVFAATAFTKLFGTSPFGDDFFIINENGNVIYSTNRILADAGKEDPGNTLEGWTQVRSYLPKHNLGVAVATANKKWARFLGEFRRIEFFGLAPFMVLAVAMALVAVYRVSRPLKVFTDKIADIRDSDAEMGERLPIKGARELANLARTFNSMADNVEAAMREKANNAAFVEKILNSLPSPVLVHSGGKIVGLNEAFSTLFGVKISQRTGTACADLLGDISLEREVAAQLVGGECFSNIECRGRRKTGEDVHLVVSQTNFEPNLESMEASGFLLITMTDVTWQHDVQQEKEALERELREAQKLEAVGQLAGGIAHEINTPSQYIGDNLNFLASAWGDIFEIITACLKYVEAARSKPECSDQVSEIDRLREAADLDYVMEEVPAAIEQSREGVKQISGIVLAMKEFSHPSAKEKSFVDLNHALENTVTISRNEWKHVAQIDLRLDPGMPSVPCLPGEMNQVFLNLIVNAAHALAAAGRTSENGRIEISTGVEGEDAVIRIADNGTGIPADVHDKIFNPFFTTKAIGKGTGQGLSIARDIVANKHGGTIGFETAEGAGTTFTVTLPLFLDQSPPQVEDGEDGPAA